MKTQAKAPLLILEYKTLLSQRFLRFLVKSFEAPTLFFYGIFEEAQVWNPIQGLRQLVILAAVRVNSVKDKDELASDSITLRRAEVIFT